MQFVKEVAALQDATQRGENDSRAGFVIIYAAIAISAALIGFFIGWAYK